MAVEWRKELVFAVSLKNVCARDDLGELGLFGLHSIRVSCRISSFSVSVVTCPSVFPIPVHCFFHYYYPSLVFIDFIVYLYVWFLDFCRP